MDQPLRVSRRQTRGGLQPNPHDFHHLQGADPVQAVLEGLARDELHHQVGQSVRLMDGVDGDDVFVADRRGRPRFAGKAPPAPSCCRPGRGTAP